MPDLLGEAAVREALGELPGWSGDASAVRRTVRAPSWAAGMALVAAVGRAADELDHHPDVDVRWTSLTFALSTHSAGGVTERDLELARRIDALATTHAAV